LFVVPYLLGQCLIIISFKLELKPTTIAYNLLSPSIRAARYHELYYTYFKNVNLRNV
jgi:hypothetical protein